MRRNHLNERLGCGSRDALTLTHPLYYRHSPAILVSLMAACQQIDSGCNPRPVAGSVQDTIAQFSLIPESPTDANGNAINHIPCDTPWIDIIPHTDFTMQCYAQK